MRKPRAKEAAKEKQDNSKPHQPLLLYVISEDWAFVSHRWALARAAQDAGYAVAVAAHVSTYADKILAAGFELIEIDFSRKSLNPIHEFAIFRQLLGIYRKHNPDLIHHVSLKPVIYGSFAARLLRMPVVNALGGLGYIFTQHSRKTALLKLVTKVLLWLALSSDRNLLILQNEDDRDYFLRNRLIQPSKLRLVRGVGVDPVRFRSAKAHQTPCKVLFPARLLKDKGIEEFVMAARILRRKFPGVRFVAVGDRDPENPSSVSDAQLARWRDEGDVEFWGWQADMPEVFSQMQIVCLPSYREGLPKALLEAGASGLPIVTTDTPGCREIVVEGVNGYLVPPRDAEGLACALEELISDPERRQQFGKASRLKVENEFSEQEKVRETLSIYRELA